MITQFRRYVPHDWGGNNDFPSAHQMYTDKWRIGVYEYNPADDGPECEIITRILASHPWIGKKRNWSNIIFDYLDP